MVVMTKGYFFNHHSLFPSKEGNTKKWHMIAELKCPVHSWLCPTTGFCAWIDKKYTKIAYSKFL